MWINKSSELFWMEGRERTDIAASRIGPLKSTSHDEPENSPSRKMKAKLETEAS